MLSHKIYLLSSKSILKFKYITGFFVRFMLVLSNNNKIIILR